MPKHGIVRVTKSIPEPVDIPAQAVCNEMGNVGKFQHEMRHEKHNRCGVLY